MAKKKKPEFILSGWFSAILSVQFSCVKFGFFVVVVAIFDVVFSQK